MTATPSRASFTRTQWAILATLLLGVFMGSLDITIMGPTLPSIVAGLRTSYRTAAWTMALYVLTYVVATPVMSAVSDRYGRRSTYLWNVALFALGSILAGAAPSMTWLLAGRAVQAVGAGGILPVASAVTIDTVPAEKRGAALGLIGATWGVASVLGPNLGGLIIQHLGWRGVFWINVPIALLVALLASRTLPATSPHQRGKFDVLGPIPARGRASGAHGRAQPD